MAAPPRAVGPADPRTVDGGVAESKDPFDSSKIQEELLAIIKEGLMHGMRPKPPPVRKDSTQDLRVKMEYMGEKRSMQIRRPVAYSTLTAKIREMYGRSLTMYYTVTNSEIIVPIVGQQELDNAIELVDKCSHMRSLRLLLSKHSDTPLSPDTSIEGRGSRSPRLPHLRERRTSAVDLSSEQESGRFSPPPGTAALQSRQKQARGHNKTRSQCSGGRGSLLGSVDEQAVEVPYISSASSHASTNVSDCCNQCRPLRLPRLHYNNNLGSAGHHGSQGGSSTSSGVFADTDSVEGRRLSATSPRAPTNWRQGRCLGSGAFGQVYLCYDADTGRELAVKRVLVKGGDVERKALRKEVASLENEITLLKNMQHERVVQYFGFHRGDDDLCIFMEYMAGGSIKDVIRQWGPLTIKLAKKYTRQILQGLVYLHHYEIVHRDIKPANILRDSDGNVKIGDFGSGKRLQTICSQNGANTFIGTPYYMAPEVIQGQRYGRKADVWSLGCTVVEMITGHPPWKDLEPMAAIFRIAFEVPQYQLPPDVDDELVKLLNGLFTRQPEKRPHAHEALEHGALQGF